MIIPVILSGGSGSRLWPLSRGHNPKQFHSLCGEQTMLQETITRLNGLSDIAAPVIVCNEQHRFVVAQQIQEIDVDVDKIILEPIGRNTAPAICAAAEYIQNRSADNKSEDDVMLVLSADHTIEDKDAFHLVIKSGYLLAHQGQLVTFGIIPDKAETGYGYIQRSDVFQLKEKITHAWNVAQFVEKPDQVTAIEYFDSGEYYWNSGMFMFQTSTIIEELKKHSSGIYQAVHKAISNASQDADFCRPESTAFTASPSDSIDYAVMEKTDKVVVLPLDANWNDIGSWAALWETNKQTENGNVIQGDVLDIDVSNSYIHANKRMVSIIGMDNCIVVETEDAVLVADKSRTQDVKKVVEQLKKEGREILLQ